MYGLQLNVLGKILNVGTSISFSSNHLATDYLSRSFNGI